MPRVGIRVVRGPDWRWKDQDGGEGYVGTVIDIGLPHRTIPERTVLVQWDNGVKTNYRTGYQGAYDLRVYDNAQIGIRHPGVVCDGCKNDSDIKGVRWKCTVCENANLCLVCYMSDKHDVNHVFERIDQVSEPSIPLQPRAKSRRVQARGIYPGALVVRGDDWDWGDQDGGSGQPGRVLSIQDWENESARSVACIQWQANRSKNVYRVGHKGKMDLRLAPTAETSATNGLGYYPEHLPILGSSQLHAEIMAKCAFRKGDRVKVGVDLESLKRMQEGHGGWNDNMARYVGATGTVHRITERGDVRVRFERYECRWTFNPAALIPLPRRTFAVGDVVQITSDEETVREAQQQQGTWCPEMQKIVGARGVVVRVYPDRDLLVRVGDSTWTLNRSVCASIPDVITRYGVPSSSQRSPSANRENMAATARVRGAHGSMGSSGDDRMASHHEVALNDIVSKLQQCKINSDMGPDRLVKEAAQGHYPIVKEIVTNFPGCVDVKVSGKTALQVACHEGHLEMVDLLLSKNAALDATDEEGDTPLHYSCFGNKPHITEFLLKHGSDVNALNRTRCSALHVSVNKQYEGCVRTLLRYGASVNLQDSYGDTALHDAITKNAENSVILEQLIAQPHLDMTLRNKAGFNYLHHAALKGNAYAARLLIAKQPSLVDVKKNDGFAALHLAALNGHREVTLCLLEGGANVDIKNHRQQTPVALAVSQGHVNVLDVLIDYKCSLELADEDDNNPLHLAAKLVDGNVEFNQEAEKKINEMRERVMEDFPPAKKHPMNKEMIAAMYLIEKGCVTVKQWHNLRNKRRKSPSELVHCESSRAVLSSWAHFCTLARLPRWAICMVCSSDMAEVIFQPCKDKVTCTHCCAKMKRCIKCHSVIESKCREDGIEIPQSVPGLNVVTQELDLREELTALKTRIQELEDSVQCSICMDASRSVAFLCGHSACVECAETLTQCHMCRKTIQKKINLF